MENEKEKPKILEWTCPECGKQIISVHPKQFDYNKEQHELSHKRKNGACPE